MASFKAVFATWGTEISIFCLSDLSFISFLLPFLLLAVFISTLSRRWFFFFLSHFFRPVPFLSRRGPPLFLLSPLSYLSRELFKTTPTRRLWSILQKRRTKKKKKKSRNAHKPTKMGRRWGCTAYGKWQIFSRNVYSNALALTPCLCEDEALWMHFWRTYIGSRHRHWRSQPRL